MAKFELICYNAPEHRLALGKHMPRWDETDKCTAIGVIVHIKSDSFTVAYIPVWPFVKVWLEAWVPSHWIQITRRIRKWQSDSK